MQAYKRNVHRWRQHGFQRPHCVEMGRPQLSLGGLIAHVFALLVICSAVGCFPEDAPEDASSGQLDAGTDLVFDQQAPQELGQAADSVGVGDVSPDAAVAGDTAAARDSDDHSSAPDMGGKTFRVSFLTYNVAGLPAGLSKSDPIANTPIISTLLNHFALAVVQEDFAHHDALAKSATHAHQYTQPAPPFGYVFSDGLSAFSRYPLSPVERHPWKKCSGIFDKKQDCLARKGFSYVRLGLPNGVMVGLYNLHMDAGRSQEDIDARSDQARQLLAHLAQRPDEALIVAGDFNLRSENTKGDKVIYLRLLADGKLKDACTEAACKDPDRLDKVLFRDSASLSLHVTGYQLDPRFVDAKGKPLSDHEPVAVDFEASRRP